jgi:hypothetical protein
MVLYEDYEKQVFLCCLQVKIKDSLLQVILYTVFVIFSLPTLGYTAGYFISPMQEF